jgi:phosphatidylglycerol:prolipoprotein diacylglycerol transferase
MYEHFPGFSWMTPYGVMMVLACVFAWALARQRAKQVGIDPSHVDLALPLAFIGGAFFAGALGWFVPDELQLAGNVFVAEGRLRLYSVAMVALGILFAYSRATGLPLRRLADLVALPALAFMGIVRVGCYLAGCCFGDVSGHGDLLALIQDPRLRLQLQTLGTGSSESLPWAVQFPAGSFAYQQHQALGLLEPWATSSLPVHPVQLYETLLLALLGLALVKFRPRFRRSGDEALTVLALYALLAFALEFLRADNTLVLGPLTINQLICLAWLAIATVLAWFRPTQQPAPPAARGSSRAR